MDKQIKTFDRKRNIIQRFLDDLQKITNLAFTRINEGTPPSEYYYFTTKKRGKKWRKK